MMINKSKVLKLTVWGLALAALAATDIHAKKGKARYNCFPTCSEVDGRMLTLAGSGLFTLGDESVTLSLVVPGKKKSFEVGIFDGDSGPPHWDRGADPLRFRLFADPDREGTSTFLIGEWYSNADNPLQGTLYETEVDGTPTGRMPDNDWFDIKVSTSDDALAAAGSSCPDGNYCYRLVVETTQPDGSTESNFKVRSTADLSVRPLAFTFVGALRNMDDLPIVYPRYPDFSDSNYDGTWEFALVLDEAVSAFTVWDGDFDYGSYDCSLMDDDDPDTCANSDSGCVVNKRDGVSQVPPWANGTASYSQGVAKGNVKACGQTTGAPNDEQDPMLIPSLPGLFSRSPAVYYQLETPVGTFVNWNPSGNQEWEQFRLETDPSQPADYYVSELPPGKYRLKVFGLDASNLNALRISAIVEGTPSASLGDKVWADTDGDGIQDAGEAGINGVEVQLYRDTTHDGILDPAQDILVATQITSGNGDYDFLGLGAGYYWVWVNPDTLPPGALLTTSNQPYLPAGPYLLAESEDHDAADFGYQLGSIGDLVWQDNNQDGVYQPFAGEVGIGGVTVELEGDLDGDGTVEVLQTTTDQNGLYYFPDLGFGNYLVRLLPDNFDKKGALRDATPTYDFDGYLDDATSVDLPGSGGRDFWLADFGYLRECVPCTKKVRSLKLRYIGALPDAHIRVVSGKGKKDKDVLFDGIVQPGEVYEVASDKELKKELTFYLNGNKDAELEMDCGDLALGPGTVVGNSVIVEVRTKDHQLVCASGF